MSLRLAQSLRRAVQIRGHQLAVVDGDTRLTWNALHDRVARLAAAFRALGVGEGDRVTMLALNSHRSLECFYAAIWAGAIIAPLNHRLSSPEIAKQIEDADPKLLVIGPEFLEMVLPLADGRPVIQSGRSALTPDTIAYEELIDSHNPVDAAQRGGDDVACLFYTGGTTGEAKGVMLSHSNIIANSLNFIGHIGMDEKTVHLHCGPLFHVAAAVRLFSVTLAGGTHVMLERFVLPEVLEAIAKNAITLATFVPTMLRSILDRPDLDSYDLNSLAYITYGAAAMPEALLKEAMAALPQVRFVQSYGMTETSPIATMLGWQEHIEPSGAKLRSAGRAALLAEIRVVDASGHDVATGERGEIVMRGPMVMQGYWRRPEATAMAIREGWMHSGDIGYLDEDGYLFVVDRLKDVIITGGENVYSQEVENAILLHPDVQECAVIGLPDEKWGERVHAVIVPREGMPLESEAVLALLKQHIAGFKCPKSFDIRHTPLPLSGANKVLKTQIRDEAMSGLPK